MAYVEIRRGTRLTAAESWARVTDWARHSKAVPLTTVRLAGAERSRVGAYVVARTGVGLVGVNDLMEITRWEPPGEDGRGFCRLEKRGRLVRGWAELEVRPADGGSRVTWREQVLLARLPGWVVPDALARRMFGSALATLLR